MKSHRYRLYIDESGDHTYRKTTGIDRYLCLTGVAIDTEFYRDEFHPQFIDFKQKHFPHNPDDPVILHREDIVNRRGPFWRLRDKTSEDAFNNELLNIFKEQRYGIFAVVIDKISNKFRYGFAALHPYHYCMVAILERYCGFLNYFNAEGDVMAESRGKTEDTQLKEAYIRLYESGTKFRSKDFFQKVLTSKEIKIKKKSDNISGLQFADLLANPCRRDVLYEYNLIEKEGNNFTKKILDIIQDKYNRHLYDCRVKGYGKILLP